ncbi:hypothetical protein GW7_05899 [Heterocephalus glaber]|uniref:Uncharacterized protein n=1 Tax=Heterocephalus glaber TaxID=10181 RepID=G5AJR3_HETGA|nr:hypothetical protein GW7_05899 [Heterocephalus glaber]
MERIGDVLQQGIMNLNFFEKDGIRIKPLASLKGLGSERFCKPKEVWLRASTSWGSSFQRDQGLCKNPSSWKERRRGRQESVSACVCLRCEEQASASCRYLWKPSCLTCVHVRRAVSRSWHRTARRGTESLGTIIAWSVKKEHQTTADNGTSIKVIEPVISFRVQNEVTTLIPVYLKRKTEKSALTIKD